MTTIDQAARALEAARFTGRTEELATFRQWLASDPVEPVILNVSGPVGVGKSSLLRAFQRIAEEEGRTVLLLDGSIVPATPEGLLRALGGADLDSVLAEVNARRPLLLFDAFERLQPLTDFLHTQFLPRLDIGVRVVIAGRLPMRTTWADRVFWHTVIRPVQLTGFSVAESRTYLLRRGVTEPSRAAQLTGATGGYPLALALAADLALQVDPSDFGKMHEWHLIVRSLVEHLLLDFPDPQLRRLLEASVVLRQFDEEALAAVAGEDVPGSMFDQLCRLSIVRPAEHGLMLHEAIGTILRADVRWRQPERFARLRSRAIAYYRRRHAAAPAAERGWLLAERFALWEHRLVQMTFFHEPEQYSVEPGQPGDHADIRHIWQHFVDQADPRQPSAAQGLDRAFLDRLLAHPGTRLRVARSQRGGTVGFSIVLPLCRRSRDLIEGHPALAPVFRSCLSPAARAALPADAAGATVYYLLHVAHCEEAGVAARAALLRDVLEMLALNGVYLASPRDGLQRAWLEEIGFTAVPQPPADCRGTAPPADGYVLDLRHAGCVAWLDALISGRQLPTALSAGAVERELQEALHHWHDDAWLAGSALLHIPAVFAADPMTAQPETVRRVILSVLAQEKDRTDADQRLAYQALEHAYLTKVMSRDRAAEHLAVSRATFYRLLKRAIKGLAAALAAC